MTREVTGHHDDRTITNHMKDLVKYGYITDEGYNGAFLILDTGTDIEEIERVLENQKQKQTEPPIKKQQELDDDEIKESESLKLKQKQEEFDNTMKGFGV
jgi:hypothetical protein